MITVNQPEVAYFFLSRQMPLIYLHSFLFPFCHCQWLQNEFRNILIHSSKDCMTMPEKESWACTSTYAFYKSVKINKIVNQGLDETS